ncbi:hypothetical protein HDU96_002355 [Phlyctochytrium bullatum]|nr:hypothetical protein HDU96_002355 [Phlyctochytrium bullatum]
MAGSNVPGVLLESTILEEWTVDLGFEAVSDAQAYHARSNFYDPLAALDSPSPETHNPNVNLFTRSRAVASSLLSFPAELASSSSPNLLLTASWLARFRRDLLTFRFVEAAAAAGRLDVLRLLDGLGVERFAMATMDAAASTGHLESRRCAAANGHFEVFECLWNAGKKCSWAIALAEAAGGGHTSVVKFLLEKAAGEVSADPNAESVRQEFFGTYPIPPPFVSAAAGGSLEILHLLESRFYPLPPASPSFTGSEFVFAAITIAVLLNQLGTIDWPYALKIAAAAGHLEVVKLLHDHIEKRKAAGESVAIVVEVGDMNEAAQNGHLQVVQFLHENRKEGCSSSALSGACFKGHLDVVKFLVETRKETITTSVFDATAGAGQLEILKYLYSQLDGTSNESGAKHSTDCSEEGMASAFRSCHHEVVKYLHQKHGLPLPPADITFFFSISLDTLRYYHKAGVKGLDQSASIPNAIINSGDHEAVRYADLHRLCRFEPENLKTAAHQGHVAVLDLLLGEVLPPDAVERVGGMDELVSAAKNQAKLEAFQYLLGCYEPVIETRGSSGEHDPEGRATRLTGLFFS